MKLDWSGQSRADLQANQSFIARDSEFYANQMVQRLILRAERILKHPSSGHSVHEYPKENLKEVYEKPYRIVYRPSGYWGRDRHHHPFSANFEKRKVGINVQ